MSDTRQTILKVAMVLFSEKGFDSISMRNIADKVNISPPALYNHFKDKQSLYLAVIDESFSNKSIQLVNALTIPALPIKRMEAFVFTLSQILIDAPEFKCLIQREQLNGDQQRLEYLAKEVFGSVFIELMNLITEIKPNCDAHGVAVTIMGMVQKHLEIEPLAQFFPAYNKDRHTPAYVTQLTMSILMAFFGTK
ncbi:MAG: TetR/AcrR family transcriptional regulator [Colwellia sp.]|nr:TetR/AcrR family transcriptional regulator [Colwellia sp.]